MPGLSSAEIHLAKGLVTIRTWTSAGSLVVAGLLAFSACSTARTPDPSAVKGTFDVGGRSLYLECVGTGSPAIVFDAGLGNGLATWSKVVPGVSDDHRTCIYDRANIGKSDTAPTPRTSANVVADLNALLEAAAIAPPYVLVGHSFASMSIRLYAATFPADVAGLVLVDPTPPTFIDDECELVDAALCATLREDAEPSSNPEGLDIEGSAEALAAAGPLPEIPFVVLAATNHKQSTITDAAIEAQIEDLWQRRLGELAASSPMGSLEVVTSGHDIQLLHPEAVVRALESVLAGVRPPG